MATTIASSTPRTLCSIPPELQSIIAWRLTNPRDIANLRLSCKQMSAIAREYQSRRVSQVEAEKMINDLTRARWVSSQEAATILDRPRSTGGHRAGSISDGPFSRQISSEAADTYLYPPTGSQAGVKSLLVQSTTASGGNSLRQHIRGIMLDRDKPRDFTPKQYYRVLPRLDEIGTVTSEAAIHIISPYEAIGYAPTVDDAEHGTPSKSDFFAQNVLGSIPSGGIRPDARRRLLKRRIPRSEFVCFTVLQPGATQEETDQRNADLASNCASVLIDYHRKYGEPVKHVVVSFQPSSPGRTMDNYLMVLSARGTHERYPQEDMNRQQRTVFETIKPSLTLSHMSKQKYRFNFHGRITDVWGQISLPVSHLPLKSVAGSAKAIPTTSCFEVEENTDADTSSIVRSTKTGICVLDTIDGVPVLEPSTDRIAFDGEPVSSPLESDRSSLN